jgi:hypothetical protein
MEPIDNNKYLCIVELIENQFTHLIVTIFYQNNHFKFDIYLSENRMILSDSHGKTGKKKKQKTKQKSDTFASNYVHNSTSIGHLKVVRGDQRVN